MARFFWIIASVTTVAGAATARADDPDGHFAVKGPGAESCDQFVQGYSADPTNAARTLGWVQGYLTAINEFSDQTYDVVSWQSDDLIAQSLVAFCRSEPDLTVQAAMSAMVRQLSADRVVEASPIVTIQVGDRVRSMYQSTLSDVQGRLALEGFMVSTTGEFDQATRVALVGYQERNGITATGFPDAVTMTRLFLY